MAVRPIMESRMFGFLSHFNNPPVRTQERKWQKSLGSWLAVEPVHEVPIGLEQEPNIVLAAAGSSSPSNWKPTRATAWKHPRSYAKAQAKKKPKTVTEESDPTTASSTVAHDSTPPPNYLRGNGASSVTSSAREFETPPMGQTTGIVEKIQERQSRDLKQFQGQCDAVGMFQAKGSLKSNEKKAGNSTQELKPVGKKSDQVPEDTPISSFRRKQSPFESCLRRPELRTKIAQKAYLNVEESLQQDLKMFQTKYARMESGGHAMLKQKELNSRYSIQLPQSPVHTKFQIYGSAGPRPASSRPQFSVQTLRRWFRSIDNDKSGSISRREMLMALRNNNELQHIFTETLCGLESGGGAPMPSAVAAEGNKDAITAAKEELRNITQILREVDQDGSGTMEWAEVVEFFRRSGYLLEYATAPHLNHAGLRNRDSLLDCGPGIDEDPEQEALAGEEEYEYEDEEYGS